MHIEPGSLTMISPTFGRPPASPAPSGALIDASAQFAIRAANARLGREHDPADLIREWHAAPPQARKIFHDNLGEFLQIHRLKRPA
ncbi:MAG: hypothetical protein RKO25_12515 [Candidatus Contendobacter sp.]|nr:hypothetical protein [Candidatus Contendobacter sp.]